MIDVTTRFFGARWDSPRVDDAIHVPTPVGELCLHCEELIEAGDRGLLTPAYLATATGDGFEWVIRPAHLECDLRGTLRSHLPAVPLLRAARDPAR